MKDSFRIYAQDNVIRVAITLSGIIFVLLALLILLNQSHLPPYVPFFNSMPWGEDRLIPVSFVLLLLPSIAIFFICNLFLSVFVYKKYALAARILTVNSFLFLLLGLVAYVQIMILVF